jgi:hypothetical protein
MMMKRQATLQYQTATVAAAKQEQAVASKP